MTEEVLPKTGYEFHPACLALPKMADETYQALRESIRDGYNEIHPILLHDGKILDGRHRYQACIDEGVEPQFMRWVGGDPFDFVRREHEARRSWTSQDQKAIALGELVEQSAAWSAEQKRIQAAANLARAEAAKERDFQGNQYRKKEVVEPHIEARLPEDATKPASNPENKTATAKAKQLGVSRAAVERTDKLKRNRPDLAEKVKSGELQATAAMRLMKKDEVEGKVAELPADKFRVIYADPPWKYNDTQGGSISDAYGGAEKHYPSMSLSELSSLGIKDLSTDDAVLFLWATSPLLPDALKLSDAWGFKYKSAFIWDKVKHNMGHYNSVRHELLLICTRGSCTPDVVRLFDSVQSIERTDKHSEKPEEFRVIIDTLYPHGSRIELFRRGAAPEGWAVWGNEAEDSAA